MWRLKVGTGGGPYEPYLYSTNNFVGRQIWEFDPNYGTPEEQAEVEKARESFTLNRSHVKPSSDVLLLLQMLKENNFEQTIPPVKVGEDEDVTYEAANITLKRALRFFCAMQTKDGHWAAEIAGPLFFLPPLVMCLYITGHLDETFSPEHKKEILRYIYSHICCVAFVVLMVCGLLCWCSSYECSSADVGFYMFVSLLVLVIFCLGEVGFGVCGWVLTNS